MKRTNLLLITIFFTKLLSAQVPASWTVTAANYQYQMGVTCLANQACVALNNPNNYVAAFVGNTCRGVVRTNTSAGTNTLGLLVVRSNAVSNEKVIFKIYNSVTNTVTNALDTLLFNQGTQVGTLSAPYVLYTNHPPSNIAISNYTISENRPVATFIGSLTASDADAGAVFTFSLNPTSLDNSNFAINSNSLTSNVIFDYTTRDTNFVAITVNDGGGCSFIKTFTINIIDENYPPSDIIIDTLSVLEDNEPNIQISTIKTVDLDNPETFTYTLVSGAGSSDNGQFSITSNRLFILTKTNYDVKTTYSIRVKTTDAAGASFEKAFEVKVIDILGNAIPLPSTNFISPNGDGKNDNWKIDNVEIYKEYALKIFDQYGQVIYEVPSNYNNEFDGKYNGNALPTGNYYYLFKNDTHIFKGNITIVN